MKSFYTFFILFISLSNISCINHIEKSISLVLESFNKEDENCLLLDWTQESDNSIENYQSMIYDENVGDLREIIAKENSC